MNTTVILKRMTFIIRILVVQRSERTNGHQTIAYLMPVGAQKCFSGEKLHGLVLFC